MAITAGLSHAQGASIRMKSKLLKMEIILNFMVLKNPGWLMAVEDTPLFKCADQYAYPEEAKKDRNRVSSRSLLASVHTFYFYLYNRIKKDCPLYPYLFRPETEKNPLYVVPDLFRSLSYYTRAASLAAL